MTPGQCDKIPESREQAGTEKGAKRRGLNLSGEVSEKGKSEPSSVRGEDLAIKTGRRIPCVGSWLHWGLVGTRLLGQGSGGGA